jgi:hypothetical protein
MTSLASMNLSHVSSILHIAADLFFEAQNNAVNPFCKIITLLEQLNARLGFYLVFKIDFSKAFAF